MLNTRLLLKKIESKTIKKEKQKELLKMRVSDNGKYSLKQFDDTKSIFIHIPKSAGISVSKGLYGNLSAGHMPLRKIQLAYNKKEFSDYFKFTFVRNPWSRLYSAYNFISQGGINKRDYDWAKNNLTGINNFEEFVMCWLTEKNIKNSLHFETQTSMLLGIGDKKINIDFIGYFENIEDDYNFIAKKIKSSNKLPLLNQTQGKKSDYTSLYTPEMIEKVSTIYQKDIINFNYVFDNSNLEETINKRNEKNNQNPIDENL